VCSLAASAWGSSPIDAAIVVMNDHDGNPNWAFSASV
jgi:hypothetical protein